MVELFGLQIIYYFERIIQPVQNSIFVKSTQ